MLGPLPTFYRFVVAACAVLCFIGVGAWACARIPGPLFAPAGAGLGAGVGLVVAVLVTHDFRRTKPLSKR